MTQTQYKELAQEVKKLRREIAEVRSVVLAIPEDREGEYRPTFIKKIVRRSKSAGRPYLFTTKESFLKHVRAKG